jgi:adenosylmethionine-8-amino-7-oxononanoate aminotransferase
MQLTFDSAACPTLPPPKGIASGYPLAGVAASSDLMAKLTPGVLGGTYGGNAVACAAAVATIQVGGRQGWDGRGRQRAQRMCRVWLGHSGHQDVPYALGGKQPPHPPCPWSP